MIQTIFLLISWIIFPLHSNQHLGEAQFLNASFDYEILDEKMQYEVLTTETEELTNKTIELVAFVIFQRHNHIRQIHNFPLLKLSVKLNALCKMYAKKHASGEIGVIMDYPLKYGFNVYYGERRYSDPNHVMKLWSNEFLFYDQANSNEDNIRNMPHLTQILWKDTMALGVCITKIEYTPMETFLLYILYDPPYDAVEFEKNFPNLNADCKGIIFYQKPLIVLLNLYLLYRF